MSTRRTRAHLVPNANDPRVLVRMVGLVAAGLRRPSSLAEVLDVELRTVHYYTQAGEWLGLLSTDGELHLTPPGLELAFADPSRRLLLYADAVWRNEFARGLLAGQRRLPESDAIAAYILEQEPDLADSTARRRASAVRSLLEPAFSRRPSRRKARGEQLVLPFSALRPTADQAEPAVDLRAGVERSPDVYARLYRVLLDQGELTTSQLRAVLDRIGGADCPLGGYAEMAIRRGDARRLGERLVVTPGAIRRREFAQDGVLVALTDPDYRSWLRGLLDRARGTIVDPAATTPGGVGARLDAQAIVAAREHERLGRRYATWDLRIFGERLTPERVRAATEAVLPGRDPLSLPSAGDPGSELAFTEDPFIDVLDAEGLPLAFPSSLSQIAGGIATLNGQLQRHRAAPAAVRPPAVSDRRARYHSGILHPGEGTPRTIPDKHSLRLRLLTHCPALSLLGALLVMDRRSDLPLQLLDRGAGPLLRWGRHIERDLIDALDAFVLSQGWLCARPLRGGLDSSTLEAIAREVGLSTRAGRRVVMEEALFVRLQEDIEARLTYDALQPLVRRLHGWLDSQTPVESDDAPSPAPAQT